MSIPCKGGFSPDHASFPERVTQNIAGPIKARGSIGAERQ